MQPSPWQPPVELSEQEEHIVKKVRKAKLFVFLRKHRHELFDQAFQEELATLVAFRKRLIEAHMDRRLLERTLEIANQSQAFGPRALRAALDSSPLWGAEMVCGTSLKAVLDRDGDQVGQREEA